MTKNTYSYLLQGKLCSARSSLKALVIVIQKEGLAQHAHPSYCMTTMPAHPFLGTGTF